MGFALSKYVKFYSTPISYRWWVSLTSIWVHRRPLSYQGYSLLVSPTENNTVFCRVVAVGDSNVSVVAWYQTWRRRTRSSQSNRGVGVALRNNTFYYIWGVLLLKLLLSLFSCKASPKCRGRSGLTPSRYYAVQSFWGSPA